MSGRGEASFVSLPGFGAQLYDKLTQTSAIQRQCREIAQELATRVECGRLLDIGTGPGKLLLELHHLNPNLELFGLDISASMIKVAEKNLSEVDIDLRCGNIRQTDYKSEFFDIVTSTGSFYLWHQPQACLEEVYRILKTGRSAYLFETYRDFNLNEFQDALRANLRQESFFHRLIPPLLLKRQLKMTYQLDELIEIVKQTSFANSHSIEKLTLGGLPIWLRLSLSKPSIQ